MLSAISHRKNSKLREILYLSRLFHLIFFLRDNNINVIGKINFCSLSLLIIGIAIAYKSNESLAGKEESICV